MSQQAKLVLKGDPGTFYEIGEKETIIGRADGCDIQLPDGFVSRRQAKLYFEAGAFVLSNTGSNPIFVNNMKADHHILSDNDEILLGKTELVFRVSQPAAPPREAPQELPEVQDQTILVPASSQPAPQGPRLVITSQEGVVSVHPLKPRRFLIGRAPDSDLQLQDLSVSRKHCTIEREKGAFVLKSLTYTNPVVIDDQPVNEKPLTAGDQFRIGPYNVTFLSDRPEDRRGVEEKIVLKTRWGSVFIAVALALLAFSAAGYGIYRSMSTPKPSMPTPTPSAVRPEDPRGLDKLKVASQQIEAGDYASAQASLAALLHEKLSPAELQKVNEMLALVALFEAQKATEAGNLKGAKDLLATFLAKHGGGEQSKAVRDRLDLYRLESGRALEVSGDHLGALREFSSISEESPHHDQAQQAVSRIWLTYQQNQVTPQPVPQLLEQADEHFQAKRYTTPPNTNAYVIYQMVLAIDPHNVVARDRINQMKAFYVENGDRYYQQKNYAAALSFYQRYTLIDPDNPEVKEKVALSRRILRREGPAPRIFTRNPGTEDRREDRVRDLLEGPGSQSQ